MRITAVEKGSPADALGLRPDDQILSMNGEAVRDELDFRFHLSDDTVVFRITRESGETRELVYESPGDAAAFGATFAETKIRLCGNKCIFCFVDQSPKGMRPSLYVRDEDYRLSFLYGNFVTLTNLKEWEIRRILAQRLSPLYVSVHSLDPDVRERLFATRRAREILPRLLRLLDGGITLHTQIVVCPGYNDGADLDRSIAGLSALVPRGVESLAIVPVGLTMHREGLPHLERVGPDLARDIHGRVRDWQRRLRARHGITFVHLADEFYHLLGMETPPHEAYDGYPQLDHGIGMTRHFLHHFRHQGERSLRTLCDQGLRRVTLVSGALFAPTLEREIARVSAGIPGITLRVAAIRNHFYGESVTVAGLLVGRDIIAQLEGRELGDRICVPPDSLNDAGVFLDDTSTDALAARLGVEVVAGFGVQTGA